MDTKTKDLIMDYYEDFRKSYDQKKAALLWQEQSKRFRRFWNNKIMSSTPDMLAENDLIPIVQILDVKGKRETEKEKQVEGVAFTNIYQPHWYQIFRDIKKDTNIKGLIDKLLKSRSDKEQARLIDEIYEKSKISNLTGEHAVVINAFLFAYNPNDHISAVSLIDRFKMIEFFGLANVNDIVSLSPGQKILKTENLISSLKAELHLEVDNRGFCNFLYSPQVKVLWKQKSVKVKKGLKKVKFLANLSRRAHPVGELINFRGMDYAPTEENGTIFLLSKVTKDLGINIISIQKDFPDAKAIKYDQKSGKRYEIFIEFEFRSSEFIKHGHLEKMKGGTRCDVIVCWEDDFKKFPEELEVVELRKVIEELPKED